MRKRSFNHAHVAHLYLPPSSRAWAAARAPETPNWSRMLFSYLRKRNSRSTRAGAILFPLRPFLGPPPNLYSKLFLINYFCQIRWCRKLHSLNIYCRRVSAGRERVRRAVESAPRAESVCAILTSFAHAARRRGARGAHYFFSILR